MYISLLYLSRQHNQAQLVERCIHTHENATHIERGSTRRVLFVKSPRAGHYYIMMIPQSLSSVQYGVTLRLLLFTTECSYESAVCNLSEHEDRHDAHKLGTWSLHHEKSGRWKYDTTNPWPSLEMNLLRRYWGEADECSRTQNEFEPTVSP